MDQKIQVNELVLYRLNIEGLDPQKIVDKLEQKNIILAVREILETKSFVCLLIFLILI